MVHKSADPTPTPLSRDTSADIESRQLEAWRRMSSVDLAGAIAAAWSAGQRMLWVGLRERFPAADDHELRVRFAIHVLGAELARRIHPDAERYPGA